MRRKENRIISYLDDWFVREMPERFEPRPELCQQKQFVSLAIAIAGGRSQQGQEYIVAWDSGSTEGNFRYTGSLTSRLTY